ncbi:hypothetical protein J6590_065128 [Homalodisca vitripennis]|nr:hypothetical protein J6590_065128 [Homalodisca vitripennis]
MTVSCLSVRLNGVRDVGIGQRGAKHDDVSPKKRNYESDGSDSVPIPPKKPKFDVNSSVISNGKSAPGENGDKNKKPENDSVVEKNRIEEDESSDSTLLEDESYLINILPNEEILKTIPELDPDITVSQPHLKELTEKNLTPDSSNFQSPEQQDENNVNNKRQGISSDDLVQDLKKFKKKEENLNKTPSEETEIESKNDEQLCEDKSFALLSEALVIENTSPHVDVVDKDKTNHNIKKSPKTAVTEDFGSKKENEFDSSLAYSENILSTDTTSTVEAEPLSGIEELDDQLSPVKELNYNPGVKNDSNTENNDEKIKLAMDWLNSTVNDLSNLSTLISVKANKFKEKKLNEENLTSYNDVLAIANSVKKLLNGIHTNYRMVEHGLEDQLNPWKVLSGLKAPENETHLIEEELDNKENKPESVNDSITNETGLSNNETPPKLAEDDLPRSQPISSSNDREPENDVKMGKESSKDCNDLDNTPENIDSCKTIEIGSMGVNNQTTGEHFLNDDNNSQSKKWVGLLSDESSSEDDVEKMVKKDSDSVQDTLITNTEHVKNEDLVQNSSTIDDISVNVTERGENNSTEEIFHGDNESRTVIEKDAQCNEALQSMLCTSSEDDTKSSLSDSSSDESDDILLDDSDLDIGSKKWNPYNQFINLLYYLLEQMEMFLTGLLFYQAVVKVFVQRVYTPKNGQNSLLVSSLLLWGSLGVFPLLSITGGLLNQEEREGMRLKLEEMERYVHLVVQNVKVSPEDSVSVEDVESPSSYRGYVDVINRVHPAPAPISQTVEISLENNSRTGMLFT